MANNELSELIDLVASEIAKVEPKKWQIDDINDLAYDIVAEGDPVQVTSSRHHDVIFAVQTETNDVISIVQPVIGQTVLRGFFRGFQELQYIEADKDTGTEFIMDELTLRLDALDDQTKLVPLVSLENIKVENQDPIDILGYDDVINEIDTLVCNQPIQLGKLTKFFAKMDIEDARTSLYLDYLNNRMSLSEIYSAVTTTESLHLTDDLSSRDAHDETVMATFARGKSFCLIAAENNDGTSANMLCINAVIGGSEAVVPLSEDIRFLGKL